MPTIKPTKQTVLLLVILLPGLAVNGCQFDPYANEYTRAKPKKKDLVGTYVLTSQSMNDTPVTQLKSQQGVALNNCKITLRADGTFTYSNMPVWVDNWANSVDQWSIKEFKSGAGHWEVGTSGSVGSTPVWGLDFLSGAVPAQAVTLAGEKAPYTIIFGYGDPDGGDAMSYERQNVALTG